MTATTECSHHHKPRSTLLHVARTVVARPEIVLARGCSLLSVPLAKLASAHFVVVGAQGNPARGTCEASRMELLTSVCLQVLTFDTAIAGIAERPIELVVMVLTIRRIVVDIELCSREAVTACSANETGSVIASGQAARGVFDGFADNGLGTAATVALARGCCSACFRRS